MVYAGSCELDVRFEERINPQKNGGPDGIGTQDLPNTTLPVSHWTHSRGVIASLLIVHRLEASANSSCLSLSHGITKNDWLPDYIIAHGLIPLVNICSSIAFVLVNLSLAVAISPIFDTWTMHILTENTTQYQSGSKYLCCTDITLVSRTRCNLVDCTFSLHSVVIII